METDVTTYIKPMCHIQDKVMNSGMEGIITINRVTDNMMGGRIRCNRIGTGENITEWEQEAGGVMETTRDLMKEINTYKIVILF